MNDNPIKIIGLKMPYGDEFCSYFESLPDNWIKCEDFRDFYRLKKGKRVYKKENYELNLGMEYLVYSPSSKRYYYKIIKPYSNMKRLLNYFKDGNVYLYVKDEREKVDFNTSEKQSEDSNDDYILF